MKSTFLICLATLTLVVMATADVDIDEIAETYFLAKHIIKNGGQCYKYGQSCNGNYPCCQYQFHNQIGCVSGQCLQLQCFSSGQFCGAFIGECCHHQGLRCSSNNLIEGVCLPVDPLDD